MQSVSRSDRRALSVVALLLAESLILGCPGGGGEPKKGKQVLLDTDFDDARLGADAAEQMGAEMGLIDDPALNEYVRAIGRRMVPFAPPRPFDYQFFIVDQEAPNAFALPGGYIFVSRGLLALANSEDELAGVIGHEITHAADRHTAGRMQYEGRLNPLSIGYMRYAQIAAYGRDQERDADRGGQILASRAGWDPMAMARFLQDLGAMDRATTGVSRLPSYFDSHPPTPERAATAASRAESLQWLPREHIAPTQADFLQKLDGLVVGPNPAEGIFEGQRFLHRDMDFSLRFPDGWQLMNTREAVGAFEPTGQAFVALRHAGEGNDPQAAAQQFVQGELQQARGKVKSEQAIQVGDLPAYRLEVEAGAIKTGGQLTFIAYKDSVYRIDLLARASDAAKYEGRGRAVVRSLRPLTDEEKASFEIIRLKIVRAKAAESLEALCLRMRNALPLGNTAVINDLFINSQLSEGQLIKVGIAEPYVPAAEQPRKIEPPQPLEKDAPAP